ncbi:NUDIX domain-containing protein [Enterococcus caccae]|uniref:MutT/nudix family protein n=1 Tax=Enterococcus caccae ATCC BAA-1240 TaxID=1158612 RepID=R3TRE4_9ENTE|nr:NUDIX hydrolase [Enterococcus caccae]EOL43723.1 MutT/nudix family protein [Enterococcus caccae ATCC BAA-1240]EOT67877.1 MutT/nudix family protein [Enterococcus caccae ATCC BAA-1240]OJG28632.1 MutT/nudix family protein [Enterococcus caccae]
MMNFKEFEEKTISRKEIFKGQIIDVVLDEVRLPNGETSTRELVFHPGAVAVIPITADNKMIMVKQFRKPMEKVLLEIPAGKIDPGEQDHPKETAERELEEETGYRADTFTFVTSMYVSPGFANELLHIYYAEDLQKVPDPRPKDDDEILELYTLTLNEAKAEIESGLICDAKTIFAVQYWELQQLKKLLKEDGQ